MPRRAVRRVEAPPAPLKTEDDINREAFEAAMRFAKQVQAPLWVLTDQSTRDNITYTRFTKEQILQYMQSPTSNEKNLRNASIYMWDCSSQYRRLIRYYAGLLRWDYIIEPLDFDREKVKPENFRKQYIKAQSQLELMNLKHEINKATEITLRDGVLYGAIWQNKNSFFIQRINPDYCTLTSIEDGTWRYCVDMTKIPEKKLSLYPPEFTTMWNTYQSTGEKYQEVPLNITFCLKADETIPRLIAIVREIIPSMTENMFLKVGKPAVNAEGAYVFTLSFDPKAVHRPSLYRKEYDGLDDVVAYVTKGAKPLSHSVFGFYTPTVDGKKSTPRRYYIPKWYKREDNPWLESNVNILNGELKSQGIEIILGPDYQP